MRWLIKRNIQECFSNNFEILCISALIEGYYNAIADGKYKIDWKENSFTNYLATYIRKTQKVYKNFVIVDVQIQPINENLPEEGTENDPDKQPVIDMRMANWNSKARNVYYIEAKNICDKDWEKGNGSKVSASKLKRRYIATGIENFITKRYPKGCLAGYVLKSKTSDCVDGINKLLKKDNRGKEILVSNLIFNNSYISIHNQDLETIELKHVFLEF